MSRRSTLAILALLAALALGLAACGGGGSSTQASGAGTEPIAAAGSSAPEATGPRGSGATQGPAGGAATPKRSSAAAGSQEAAGSIEGAPSGQPSEAPEAQEAGEASRESSAKSSTSAPGASLGPRRPHRPHRPPRTVTRASARAAERAARRKAHAAQSQIEQKAGAAAPFVVEEGDNSIPTYGSESTSGQLAAAEAALSRYLAARATGEWGPACAQMSAQVQKQLALLAGEEGGAGGGCPQAYAKLAEKIPASARANPMTAGLTALRIESPHAFALFYGPGEQQYMMPLEEEGGAWKVTQIEPVPWPIGSTAG